MRQASGVVGFLHMNFQYFDEWFAIVDPADKETCLPGRLSFDPGKKKIRLLAVDCNFASAKLSNMVNSGIIVGLLDYQRPTTLFGVSIVGVNSGSIGVNTRYMRQSYTVGASTIIKNIYINSIEEKLFLDFRSSSQALQAYVAWQVIANQPVEIIDPSVVELVFSETLSIKHEFSDKSRFEIEASARKGWSHQNVNLSLSAGTSLVVSFNEAVSFDEIAKIARRIDIMFCFLISARLEDGPFYGKTTHKVRFNGEDESVIAEVLYAPQGERKSNIPYIGERMFTLQTAPIKIDRIMFLCKNEDQELFYWMNLSLSYGSADFDMVEYFGEIVSSIEKLDKRINGEKIDGKNVILRHRLERLIGSWRQDKFGGSPDVSTIVKLRNMKAHGDQHSLDQGQINCIIAYNQFLTALLTFHVLKIFGFDRVAIAEGFRRMLHKFAFLIPEELKEGT